MVLTCAVCRSVSYSQSELGYYICNECGTQSQDFVLEEGEFDASTFAARSERKKEPVLKEDVDTHEVLPGYCHLLYFGFQCILKKQVEILIREFQFHPALETVVKNLWCFYLYRTKKAFVSGEESDSSKPTESKKRKKHTNKQAEQEETKDSEEEDFIVKKEDGEEETPQAIPHGFSSCAIRLDMKTRKTQSKQQKQKDLFPVDSEEIEEFFSEDEQDLQFDDDLDVRQYEPVEFGSPNPGSSKSNFDDQIPSCFHSSDHSYEEDSNDDDFIDEYLSDQESGNDITFSLPSSSKAKPTGKSTKTHAKKAAISLKGKEKIFSSEKDPEYTAGSCQSKLKPPRERKNKTRPQNRHTLHPFTANFEEFYKNSDRSLNVDSLKLSFSLAFIYIASVCLREPIMIPDILKLAKSEKIPFMSAHLIAREAFAEKWVSFRVFHLNSINVSRKARGLPSVDVKRIFTVLRPIEFPSALYLFDCVRTLTRFLFENSWSSCGFKSFIHFCMERPPQKFLQDQNHYHRCLRDFHNLSLNVNLILYRIVNLMLLPGIVYRASLQLIKILSLQETDFSLLDNIPPRSKLVSLVIVAIKFIYTLRDSPDDDPTTKSSTNSSTEYFSFSNWGYAIMIKNLQAARENGTEASSSSSDPIHTSYLEFCDSHLFKSFDYTETHPSTATNSHLPLVRTQLLEHIQKFKELSQVPAHQEPNTDSNTMCKDTFPLDFLRACPKYHSSLSISRHYCIYGNTYESELHNSYIFVLKTFSDAFSVKTSLLHFLVRSIERSLSKIRTEWQHMDDEFITEDIES